MPRSPLRLNDRQQEILRWISDGCPQEKMLGSSYKTTAVALQNRGLITLDRRRGRWSAVVTEAGEQWLTGVTRRVPEPRLSLVGEAPTAEAVAAASTRLAATPAARDPAQPTEAMITAVAAAGGELEVDSQYGTVRVDALLRAAIRFGKVPPGQLLVAERGTSWTRTVLRLVDLPPDVSSKPPLIVAPASLRGASPAIRDLIDSGDMQDAPAKVRGRALRLLQVVATFAEQQSWPVTASKSGRPRSAAITVTVGESMVEVQVQQERARVPHVPSAAELARAERDSWVRIPLHDDVPTERLRLELDGPHSYAGSKWADGQRRVLEDVLGLVVQELRIRAVLAARDRDARERAAAERRRAWEAAMARAADQLTEATRANTFRHQLACWQEDRQLREFIGAMRESAACLTGDARADALNWIAWCERYVAQSDPLQSLGMPPAPKPDPESLRPHLNGLSPYGPPER